MHQINPAGGIHLQNVYMFGYQPAMPSHRISETTNGKNAHKKKGTFRFETPYA
jgi:hypothetical protein